MEDTSNDDMAILMPKRISSYDIALNDVKRELEKALEEFPNMRSPHEGLAIIEEEFLELRDEIFWGLKIAKQQVAAGGSAEHLWKAKIKKEAVQLAAMATRLMAEI